MDIQETIQSILKYFVMLVVIFLIFLILVIIYSFLTGTFVPTNFDAVLGEGSWDYFITIPSLLSPYS